MWREEIKFTDDSKLRAVVREKIQKDLDRLALWMT